MSTTLNYDDVVRQTIAAVFVKHPGALIPAKQVRDTVRRFAIDNLERKYKRGDLAAALSASGLTTTRRVTCSSCGAVPPNDVCKREHPDAKTTRRVYVAGLVDTL